MNDTQLATREFRSNQWMQIIQDRSQSGLTIREYCSQNGLSQNSYYYWLKVIRKRALEERETAIQRQEFVELPSVQLLGKTGNMAAAAPERLSNPGSGLTLEMKGLRIQIQETTSMELLSKTLEVVSHAV